MKKGHDLVTFDLYNTSFTYTLILVSYRLKVPSTLYLISISEHKMNETRRTATLDSFIIKKPKNISIISSNPHSSVDAHTETTDVNLHQHAMRSNVIEMTKTTS